MMIWEVAQGVRRLQLCQAPPGGAASLCGVAGLEVMDAVAALFERERALLGGCV